jgi:hypothetical protein
MADKEYNDLDEKGVIQKVHDLWRSYSNKRETWATKAQEDKEFRLGIQWTSEQRRVLEERGQSPVVVNRIHPAVETAKAMITANRPSFRVAAREDSDNKVAQVISSLLSYMYDISDGRSAIRDVIDDYYVTGLGYMHVYQDPMMDMGKGEVCMHSVDPLDVYVDPNSRDRYFDDAENIIISRLFTRDQAMKMYPMYKNAIENSSSDRLSDRPDTQYEGDGSIIFPEDTETQTYVGMGNNDEYVRGYEWYYKEMVNRYRIFETFSGVEDLLEEDRFQEYLTQPAWIINGEPIVDEQVAKQMVAQLEQQAEMAYSKEVSESLSQGMSADDLPPPPPLDVQVVTFNELYKAGMIQVTSVQVKRVHQCVVVGDKKLYSRILPVEKYPIIPFVNIHTRTPYPVSDVSMIKGMQQYINKTRSLIIAHATTSTNTKY